MSGPRIVAVTMVRDELDVLPHTLVHLIPQVDAVIVSDNGSTDGTREWLDSAAAELLGPPAWLTVVDDPDPRYVQAEKMTALARRARDQFGADWVLPFDADEAWTLPGDRLASVPSDVGAILVRPFVVVPTLDPVTWEPLPASPNPFRAMTRRHPTPEPWPKVVLRADPDGLTIAQGNHAAQLGGHGWQTITGDHPALGRPIEVRHAQYRSLAHLERKVTQGHAAYLAAADAGRTDVAGFGGHWADLATASPAARAIWWREWCARGTRLVRPLPDWDHA